MCLNLRPVFVLVMVLMFICPQRADASWPDERARQRQQRVELREMAQQDRQARAESAVQTIDALLSEVEAGELKADPQDLWPLIAGLARLSPEHLGDLPDRVRKIPAGPLTPTETEAWSSRLGQALAVLTDRPWELLQKAAAVGEVRLATDFMWEVLYFDPDFAPIREALGQVKVDPDKLDAALPQEPAVRRSADAPLPEIAGYDPDRYWLSPFNAARLREGLIWTEAYGWAMAAHPDRYRQGYVYDLQRKRWTRLDEANAYHSRAERDWMVRTQHVEVRGTADLHVLAEAATRLEALYKQIFGEFAGFFADSRQVDALRLAVGLAEHDPLVVWVFRNHAEYVERTGAPQWSAGVFVPSMGQSFFYGRAGTTMYHEFTHHVLHVLNGGNDSPAWLTEGIAVYTQSVGFESGRVRFPGAGYDEAMPLDDLLAIRNNKTWHRVVETADRRDGANPYPAAGSVVTFCMNSDDERYRADFIDYLRDSYRNLARNRAVWDYLGLSEAEFIQRYRAWGAG